MNEKLDEIINQSLENFANISSEEWKYKRSPSKWSRKEILGHLVDSAIKNLQRFTEVASSPTPYRLVSYPQDQLVLANRYQQEPTELIISLWSSINRHISYVIGFQTQEHLALPVDIDQVENVSLKWLMNDYIEHMQHHLKQIANYPTAS